ncbi:MAG: T9SS type A sorting domain-containing protein, partial [Paludibacteraceae bacterium]|nr:T9SS type A sorting domain-containing protein [Paludibacteraceae bacterium]
VLFYNYEAATFMSTASTASTVLLKPQHGFIFTPGKGKTSLTITDGMLADGYTHSRSAEATVPTLSLNLYNANTQKGFSNVVLHYDSEVDITNGSATDIEKVFAPNADSPELYIIANDKQYTRYTAGNQMLTIPLGINLKKDMNVRFERVYAEGIDYATLVDYYTGQEIDLLRNSHTTEALLAGNIEGRFFLNIVLSNQQEFTPDEDVPTDIEQELEENNAISIYVEKTDGSVINVLGKGVELETIYVSDMTGRTMQYNVSGNYASLSLPVSQGVYIVQVIGDNTTKTQKVVLK